MQFPSFSGLVGVSLFVFAGVLIGLLLFPQIDVRMGENGENWVQTKSNAGCHLPKDFFKQPTKRMDIGEGVSMLPTFASGNTLIVTPFNQSWRSKLVGCIVIFEDVEGDYVSHRVVEVGEGGFVSWGDNNPISDGWNDFNSLKYVVLGVDYT